MTEQLTEDAVHTVERYLFRLGIALGQLPAAERDEYVREIRMHVLDSVDAAGTSPPEAVDAVLERLGPPEQLATNFEREQSLSRASRTFSPFTWLRTTARWALSGIQYFIAFWIAVIGYCFGSGFFLAGLLKPLFPSVFGLFVSPHTLSLNRQNAPGEVELLHSSFIPLAMVFGALIIVATTVLLKWIVERFAKAKQYVRRYERL